MEYDTLVIKQVFHKWLFNSKYAICKYDVSTIWRTCIHNILSNQRHTLSTLITSDVTVLWSSCTLWKYKPHSIDSYWKNNAKHVVCCFKNVLCSCIVILSFSHRSNISSGVLISQQKPRWLWWIRKVDMIQVSIIYKKYLENGKKLSRLNCLQHEWRDFPKPSKKQRAECWL